MMELSSEARDLKTGLEKAKAAPFVVVVPMDTGVMVEVEAVLKAHLSTSAGKVNVFRSSIRTDTSKQALTKAIEELTRGIQRESMETGLFSEANLFVIQHFPSTGFIKEFKHLSTVANDQNGIIMGIDQARGANSMLTHAKKHGFVLSIKNAARGQAINVVRTAARRLRLTLEGAAVTTIVDLIGSDRGYLNAAVQNLADAYGTGHRITAQECTSMVSRRAKVMPWDLTDAIGSRDLARSIKFLNLLLDESGQDALRVFNTMMNYVRKLMAAQPFLMESDPAGTMASRLKMNPYSARKIIEQTRRFTASELSDFISKTADMEVMLKSASSRSAIPALTLFVTRIVVKIRR